MSFFPKGPTRFKIIFRTSVSHHSMTKRISEMCQLEREQWLPEVLQKHQSSVIYSFIFIHSVRSEINGNMRSVHCGIHTKRGKWDTLSFSKEEILGFHV